LDHRDEESFAFAIFWRAAAEPVLNGFGINSSLASLPLTLKALDSPGFRRRVRAWVPDWLRNPEAIKRFQGQRKRGQAAVNAKPIQHRLSAARQKSRRRTLFVTMIQMG